MRSSLYNSDAPARPQHRADPPRHLRQGQQVNHVDRTNVAGLPDLVKSDPNPALTHLLNIQACPGNAAPGHGHIESSHSKETHDSPSVPQRIDIDEPATERHPRPCPATNHPSINGQTTTQTTQRVSPNRTHRHNTCTQRARARYIGP
jgi:hypothetical protein